MTSTENDRAREDARNKTTGKFGEQSKADPGVNVIAEQHESALGICHAQDNPPNWGAVAIHIGSRTPWGAAQFVECPANGIAVVGTDRHGGVKLSVERNKAIPAALRNSSGWYEEDCEAYIVAWIHPDGFAHTHGGDLEAISAYGKAGVINWFPAKYEAATGEIIPFGQSRIKDEDEWNRLHAGKPCLYSVGAGEHPDYPGMVVVPTYRVGANDGAWTEHMMPVADYETAQAQRAYGAAQVRPLLPGSAVDVTAAEKALRDAAYAKIQAATLT